MVSNKDRSASVIYYPLCKLEPLIRHAYINKTVKKEEGEGSKSYLAAISRRVEPKCPLKPAYLRGDEKGIHFGLEQC